MAKKKFQNNYTTPEQSKKLLALGIPDWTADCYFYEEGGIADDCTPEVVPFGEPYEDASMETMFSSYVSLPCWSLGRLIEIYRTCVTIDPHVECPMMSAEDLVSLFITMLDYCANDQDCLDLSKLEEEYGTNN